MAGEFQVTGQNPAALFTLKIHRSDGMALVAMNWKDGTPPTDFVGFAIEYKEPGGDKFEALRIFDHYHFRVAQQEAKKTKKKKLQLALPPRQPGEKPWWDAYFTKTRKIRDRELFS